MEAANDFGACLAHCDFDYVPEGLARKYRDYEQDNTVALIPREFLSALYVRYQVPERTQRLIEAGIEAIEQDPVLFDFTKFLVADMTTARNRCDDDFYTNMSPGCLGALRDRYSFLLLLACVPPSLRMLEARGVPGAYYEEIPHQFLKGQLAQINDREDFGVHDFQWKMNFYTCSIFLLDRFFFIPHRFQDAFTMYRHRKTRAASALRHAGGTFRRDGQQDGINGVFDADGAFRSSWREDDTKVTANRINPLGFVEREPITLAKREWEPALQPGDIMLALHVPSGPGYTPERLKSSMAMAVEFYERYFPELDIKGFWSESWLYDSRLSLVLDAEKSNIVRVQRQMYTYPIQEGDGMLRLEVFGDRGADPSGARLETSLQKAIAEYMSTGARFNTLSMVVLKEEVGRIGEMPYIRAIDFAKFEQTVDSHLEGRRQA